MLYGYILTTLFEGSISLATTLPNHVPLSLLFSDCGVVLQKHTFPYHVFFKVDLHLFTFCMDRRACLLTSKLL